MLYNVIAAHLEMFLASLDDDPDATGLAASLLWRWRPVFRHWVSGGKRADALRRRSSLRRSAVLPHEAAITRILRPLKVASVSPPIAPARRRQALGAFD